MRRAHVARMLGAAVIAMVTAGALSACFIPSPPPVPQPPNLDRILPGSDAPVEVREGFIPGDGTTSLELQIDVRLAVVLGAVSTDDEDLRMRLIGDGVDLENDDGYGELDGMAFDMSSRDPVLAAVLEPGSYTIELGEYGGDSTGFRLQVLVSTTTVGTGETIALEVVEGLPAVAIASLTTGAETIAAVADFDSTLWVRASDRDTAYTDDDSGGDSSPLLSMAGAGPQDVVVVVASYAGDEGGPVELSVE